MAQGAFPVPRARHSGRQVPVVPPTPQRRQVCQDVPRPLRVESPQQMSATESLETSKNPTNKKLNRTCRESTENKITTTYSDHKDIL